MRNPENAQEAAAMEQPEADYDRFLEAAMPQEAEAARAEAEAKAQQQQEAKHTPGPWRVDAPAEGWAVVHAASEKVIFVAANATPEDHADAHLIAAAPKMLDVLQQIDEYLTRDEDDDVSNFIGTRSELHQHVRHLIDLATDNL